MQTVPGAYHTLPEGPISTREPPAPQAWLSVQETVRHLYVDRKLPLRDVKLILERDFGFRNASERMFKSRLKAWGYLKNAKKDDWGALAILHRRRKDSGKKRTIFTVRERQRTVKDLQKYIRSLNMTDEEFLASIEEHNIEIPEYIRAETPDPEVGEMKDSPSEDSSREYTPSPKQRPMTSADEPSPNSPLDQSFHSPQIYGNSLVSPPSITRTASISSSSMYLSQPSIVSARSPNPVTAVSEGPSQSLTIPCDQLQRDIEAIGYQMISPAPLSVRYGSEDIEAWTLVNAQTPDSLTSTSPDIEFLCSRCHQPSSLHFASLDSLAPSTPPRPQSRSILNPVDLNSAPTAIGTWQLPVSTRQDDGAWKWSARCFLACIAFSKGDDSAAQQILVMAAQAFERMLQNGDPMLLSAAQQVAGILGMQNQGHIASMIMQATYDVCERLLPPSDPIRTVIALWTATAMKDGLVDSPISPDDLKRVYEQFRTNPGLGDRHPYTIAARYAYGWILKYRGYDAQAEAVLTETYLVSKSVFGDPHMQSIFPLAAAAGAQRKQQKFAEAIGNFEAVIINSSLVLGTSHPYTLEGKRRLADTLKERDKADGADIPSLRVEQLYWQVLVGRVKMLGRRHNYTEWMHYDYECLCEERGTLEDRRGAIAKLLGKAEAGGKEDKSPSPQSDDGSIHEAY